MRLNGIGVNVAVGVKVGVRLAVAVGVDVSVGVGVGVGIKHVLFSVILLTIPAALAELGWVISMVIAPE